MLKRYRVDGLEIQISGKSWAALCDRCDGVLCSNSDTINSYCQCRRNIASLDLLRRVMKISFLIL